MNMLGKIQLSAAPQSSKYAKNGTFGISKNADFQNILEQKGESIINF